MERLEKFWRVLCRLPRKTDGYFVRENGRRATFNTSPGVSCISGGAVTGGDEEGKGTAGRRESRGRSGPFVRPVHHVASVRLSF